MHGLASLLHDRYGHEAAESIVKLHHEFLLVRGLIPPGKVIAWERVPDTARPFPEEPRDETPDLGL